MNIARSLTRARKACKISRKELARRAGCDPSLISHIEAGRRHPRQDTLESLARAVHLDVSELVRLGERR